MTERWVVLSEAALLDALRRCANTEDPDAVYAELYANSDHEQVE